MKRNQAAIRIPALALLGAVSMATLPATSVAGDDVYAEWEIRREQELARRQMEERDRALAEAIRGQEAAIRRMEATSSRLEASAQQNAQQQLEQARAYSYPYSYSPSLSPVTPEARAQLDRLRQDDTVSGMTLASLTERLGSYFGAQSGVLVVRAGADAPFGLQDGDVLLSIDGRVPTESQHAARILRSYQPGEPVKLQVQRDRQVINLDTRAPGQRRD